MSDNKNKSKDKARGRDVVENTPKEAGAEVTSAAGDITNVGDTYRKTIDTGDISRASIAKGIRSPDDVV
jgi:hypothetical protein